MKPQDLLLLLKIIALGRTDWGQKEMAEALEMSQSEISEAVKRLKYSGLLYPDGKTVLKEKLYEFLKYGMRYVFPQKPGPIVIGTPTAFSSPFMKDEFRSEEQYVWPDGYGQSRGHSIQPLYPSVVKAIKKDEKLYQLLSLADSVRVGRSRERKFAIDELKRIIIDGE